MPDIRSFIHQLLSSVNSRRKRITQTVHTLLALFNQQSVPPSGEGSGEAGKRPFPILRSLLNQARHPRKFAEDMYNLWPRAIHSIAYLQATYYYQRWIDKTEPDRRELAQQQREESGFAYRPLISFLTPVYNPEVAVLRDTLQSVQDQTYPHWEFCLANGSTNPEVGQLLDKFAEDDGRFRVIHLAKNLGISQNTNQALEIAQGEFIALLDHDDLVSPDMLFAVVSALNQDPSWDIIYFDEDKVSENGQSRHDPWFKPSKWSPDLLLSTNYLMHSVIRHALVKEVGGFNAGVDGAQDWDLSLRLVEKTKKIHHIPRIFYHWRQVVGSAARDANAKPWAFAAQERCLQQHFQRLGHGDVQISFPRLGTVRLLWPTKNAKVSIIIPTKNNLPILQACLDSILTKTTYPFYEILVVDNQSNDTAVADYYEELANHSRIRILDYPHPYNFQKINNWAASQCAGEVLLFLNNDTEVIEPTWLEEMAGWALRAETGVVGTKLLRPNGKVQHAGLIMGLIGHGSHVFEDCNDHVYTHFGSINWYRNYQAVTGACMAIRRSVFDELDGFDEAYIVGFGDIDLCLRAEDAGYRNVYTPFATLLHHEGGTRGLSLPPSDVLRASAKMWSLVQKGDGYFNPNLSYSSRQPVVSALKEENRGKRLVRIMTTFGLIDKGMSLTKWESTLAQLPATMTETAVTQQTSARTSPSRILLVTHELTRSGAPIIMWMMARHLHHQGYQLQILSPVEGSLRQDYEAEGIPVTVAPTLLRDSRTILPHLPHADIVICNTILSWRVVHAARAFTKPCLWWVHETAFGVNLAEATPQIAQAFTAATQVIFPSQTTANQYLNYTQRDNFSVLLHGFNVTPPETNAPPVIKKQPDDMHLVCVATIEKRKGQDLLLKAIDTLPDDIKPKIHLHFIGRKHISPLFYLKIAWLAYWRKNIHLHGELLNKEVLQYIQESDLFVMASRDEALPVVLIEAMALGKAILTTNAGGISELINTEENGLVVDVEDVSGLVDGIIQLYCQPELRQKLGQKAQADYQSRHTLAYSGHQMETILAAVYGNGDGQSYPIH